VEHEVVADGPHRVRKDIPARRHHRAVPAGHEQHGDVGSAVGDPELQRHEVPVPAKAQVLASRQGNHRVPGLLLVERRPGMRGVGQVHPPGQPEPLLARRAVVGEVELRERREDLQARADHEEHEQDIGEVGDDDPDREHLVVDSQHGHQISSALFLSPCRRPRARPGG
jgi:hypothetical protein